jgi:hypothetical protein
MQAGYRAVASAMQQWVVEMEAWIRCQGMGMYADSVECLQAVSGRTGLSAWLWHLVCGSLPDMSVSEQLLLALSSYLAWISRCNNVLVCPTDDPRNIPSILCGNGKSGEYSSIRRAGVASVQRCRVNPPGCVHWIPENGHICIVQHSAMIKSTAEYA